MLFSHGQHKRSSCFLICVTLLFCCPYVTSVNQALAQLHVQQYQSMAISHWKPINTIAMINNHGLTMILNWFFQSIKIDTHWQRLNCYCLHSFLQIPDSCFFLFYNISSNVCGLSWYISWSILSCKFSCHSKSSWNLCAGIEIKVWGHIKTFMFWFFCNVLLWKHHTMWT